MAKIIISLVDSNPEDYSQFQSVFSEIEFETGDKNILEYEVLDGDGDEKYNLDTLKSFTSKWEGIAQKEDFVFEVDDEVYERIFDLDSQLQDEETEDDKTWERCQD